MSTRQKRNKLLIRKCNETIIEKTVDTFLNTGLDIYAVVGYQLDEMKQILVHRFGNEIQIVENKNFKSGIATSVKAGLSAAGDRYEYYGFCNGDKPFIHKKSIVKILKYLKDISPEILVPLYREKSGHPTFFSKNHLTQLLELDGDIGGRVIIKNNPESVTYLPIDDKGIILDMDFYLSN
jgi:molybdenum cofactor cytidylyltransferase